ncbi:hypothetical protein [Pantoea eucrina]|uniref:hypothetical protein n=1 Tax=Pantoea eucrina TaxID=472693 RepID=UPI002FDB40CF
MKKLLIAVIASACLTAGFANAADEEMPDYVSSAKFDVESALVANIFQRPDFKCHALQASDQTWTLGCFLPDKNPSPFILFTVTPDPEKTNPPMDYKVHALNGKAKQYAQNKALRFMKIDEIYNSPIDIDKMRNQYIEKFVD